MPFTLNRPLAPRPLIPGYSFYVRKTLEASRETENTEALVADEPENPGSNVSTVTPSVTSEAQLRVQTCTCTGGCLTSRCPCRKAERHCTEACGKCMKKCKNRLQSSSTENTEQTADQDTPLEHEMLIAGYSDKECRELMSVILKDNPELLKNLQENQSDGSDTPQSTEPPRFCKCGRCREMPTPGERKCCGQRFCLTLQRACRTITIDSEVVRTAINSNCDVLVSTPHHDNRSMRHAAYRQYIMWRHGHLGRGNRVVVPSCVVWMVRDRFPSPDGVYTGFKLH